MSKKVISKGWVVLVCLGICGISFGQYGGGSGTAGDPYLIYTAEQLNAIGANSSDWTKSFRLMEDIDLSVYTGTQFNRIGIDTSHAYTGILDGNGHTISNFIYDSNSTINIGLVGYLGDNGVLKNLGLIGVHVNGYEVVGGLVGYNKGTVSHCYVSGSVSGYYRVGGLVGENSYYRSVSNCCSTGIVSGYISVGGLVGRNMGEMSTCYSSGPVTGSQMVGGLVGASSDGEIMNCSSTGSVSGTKDVGGLVGMNIGFTAGTSQCTVLNCYSSGAVSGGTNVGGLAGNNFGTLTHCYSTGKVSGSGSWHPIVGGLVGTGISAQVSHSFWDVQTSGQDESRGGIGMTTAQMQDINTYLADGWDFVSADDGPNDVWAVPPGGGYPVLWWQLDPPSDLPAFGGGKGTKEDPYLVADANDLNSIGTNPRLMDKYFRIIQDIDLSGVRFYPIGDSIFPFTGVFDGGGHKVSNLACHFEGEDYVGLFRYLELGVVVRNLGLWNATVSGRSYVGGLAGYNKGTLSGCCILSGDVSGTDSVGGLVGYNMGFIAEGYSLAMVTGADKVGGLVGMAYYSSRISNCYASGLVTASGGRDVGGLLGSSSDRGQGLNSFWDLETTGQGFFGGMGKTTAQMQDIDTYLSTDGTLSLSDDGPDDIWAMPPGGGYPILWWQVDPLPALPAFGGGAGTTEDPYLIADANQLNLIGSNPRLLGRCFRLVQDIDLQGVNLHLIGDRGSPFMGVFDGDGHAILNFVYEAKSTSYVGLFPSIGQTGEVKNLSLQNVNVKGLSRVGSLAGRNDGRVSGCQATGSVSGSDTVGGLIGWNRIGTVSDCSASVKTSGGRNIGDLVGWDGVAEPSHY